MMHKCQRCGLPQFDGVAGYAGPQCKCWAFYAPNPPLPRAGGHPVQPMTEEDVRRIVRDELDKAGTTKIKGV